MQVQSIENSENARNHMYSQALHTSSATNERFALIKSNKTFIHSKSSKFCSIQCYDIHVTINDHFYRKQNLQFYRRLSGVLLDPTGLCKKVGKYSLICQTMFVLQYAFHFFHEGVIQSCLTYVRSKICTSIMSSVVTNFGGKNVQMQFLRLPLTLHISQWLMCRITKICYNLCNIKSTLSVPTNNSLIKC